jgi:antitoxin (DNA-binding transcriptional repressor) of toxin-antitoxin stability system
MPDILDDVEAGKKIEATRRGRAVAILIDFGEAYRAFISRYSLDEIGLEPDSFDSTRDPAPGRRVRL